jgi:hypothetical protein
MSNLENILTNLLNEEVATMPTAPAPMQAVPASTDVGVPGFEVSHKPAQIDPKTNQVVSAGIFGCKEFSINSAGQPVAGPEYIFTADKAGMDQLLKYVSGQQPISAFKDASMKVVVSPKAIAPVVDKVALSTFAQQLVAAQVGKKILVSATPTDITNGKDGKPSVVNVD